MDNGVSLNDIQRMNKQGWMKAESFGVDLAPADEGIKWKNYSVKKQNTRNNQIADILDIGAGTRCKSCGMLHMCWLPIQIMPRFAARAAFSPCDADVTLAAADSQNGTLLRWHWH